MMGTRPGAVEEGVRIFETAGNNRKLLDRVAACGAGHYHLSL